MTYVSQPGEPAAEAFAPRWAARAADSPRRGWGGPPAAIHFAIGLPDPLLFPTTELLAATEVVLREQSATALQYGPAKGTPALLEVVREKLRRDEGLNLGPEQIMISSGSSQGISLVLRALCEPGDVVLCEAPTFLGTLGNFNRAEVRTVGLPVDEHGLDVRAAETILADLAAQGVRPKLLYTIPTFQNPMGVTMPLTRRVALLGLARRYDLLVLEDDAYRDLAFEGTPPPSLLSLDGEGRVIRVGTFSKILAAGMRLGWALGTGDAINRMIRMKDDGGSNPFAAHVAATFARAGELEPLIARYVVAYRQKRDVALEALARYMPPGVSWTRPGGGFFIWIDLPAQLRSVDLLPRAREEGVDFLPGVDCFPHGSGGQNGIRMAFSTPTVDQVADGIKRLGRLVESSIS